MIKKCIKICLIIIIIFIVLLSGKFLYKNIPTNSPNETILSEINREKEETYIDDLDNDGSKERISIKFIYDEDDEAYTFVDKTNISVMDETNNRECSISIDNKLIYPMVEVIDIDENDGLKEIYITSASADASPQFTYHIIYEYKNKELKQICVNKEKQDIPETFDKIYDENNYIVGGDSQMFNIEKGEICVNSNSGKEIIYKLNDNHELELYSYRFNENSEFYTDFITIWQGAITAYDAKDITSSRESISISEQEIEIVKVEDWWLEAKIDGETKYIYIENVVDVCK